MIEKGFIINFGDRIKNIPSTIIEVEYNKRITHRHYKSCETCNSHVENSKDFRWGGTILRPNFLWEKNPKTGKVEAPFWYDFAFYPTIGSAAKEIKNCWIGSYIKSIDLSLYLAMQIASHDSLLRLKELEFQFPPEILDDIMNHKVKIVTL